MKKYFVILLFILTSSFVPCLKASTQTEQVAKTEQAIPAEEAIKDKSSLQNFSYYFVFTLLFIAFAVWISRKSKEERNKIKGTVFVHVVVLMMLSLIIMPGMAGLQNILLFPFLAKSICIVLAILGVFIALYCKKKIFFSHSYLFTLNLVYWLFVLYMLVRFFCFQYGNYQFFNAIEKNYSQTGLIRIGVFSLLLCVCNACFCVKNKCLLVNTLQHYCYLVVLLSSVFFIFLRNQDFNSYSGDNQILIWLKTSQFSVSYVYGIKIYYFIFLLLLFSFWQKTNKSKMKAYWWLSIFFLLAIGANIVNTTSKRNIVFGYSFGCLFLLLEISKFKIRNVLKVIMTIILLILLTCSLQKGVKLYHQRGGLKILITRQKLGKGSINNFLDSKIFGTGVGNPTNGYAHNAFIDLLGSGGLVAVSLWFFPFIYSMFLFFRFKCYDKLVIYSFVFLGFLFLQSCFTGFYLYYTIMYFLIYFIVYRLKFLNSLRSNA